MKNNNKSLLQILLIPAVLAAAILLSSAIQGCGNDNPAQPTASNTGAMGFSAGSDGVTQGNNPQSTLVIYEAKVMINDLKIHPDGDDNEEHGENIKVGPFVIDLNLDSKVTLVTNSMIPPGNYRKVKFEIHKLQPNDPVPDPEFSDANGRYSVIVKGSFNGIDFLYKSQVTANQKVYLQKVLTVSATASSNITFFASPYMWFYDEHGGGLLDPALPVNRLKIEDNIRDNLKNQIRVFVDCDHDGHPDH